MLDSMTFNGQRNDDIYLLEGRSKSPYHPVNRDISHVGKHFRLRKTEKDLLPIKQPIGFTKNGPDVDVIKRLTDWLITDDWAVLSFDNEPGKNYMAVLQNDMEDFKRFVTQRSGTLEFVAKSSFGDEKTISVGTSYGPYPIGGQETTPWTSKAIFREAASQYTLENNSGGKIILNYDFVSGDVLKIDYNKRYVEINNNDQTTTVDLRTVWFELEPDTMQLKASQETNITYTELFY